MGLRSERRKQAGGSRHRIVAISLGAAAIGALGYYTISSAIAPVSAGWDSVGALSQHVEFSDQKFPQDWADGQNVQQDNDSFSQRNPAPAYKDSCTFVRSTTYLTNGLSGRGDQYLSQDLAFSLSHIPEGVDVGDTEISVDGQLVSAAVLSWSKGSVLARTFDEVVHDVPADIRSAPPRNVGTELNRGIPAVTAAYRCNDQDDYSQDTAQELFSGIRVVSGR